VSKLSRKPAVFLALLLILGTGASRRASAQAPTGEFLCSVPGGAAPDGAACSSDLDCGAGVCVVAQGVCNSAGASDDGFPCDCAGGTCLTSTNTCQGGTAAGLSCDPTTNCSNNQCIGTQKICIGGSEKGFSCLRSNQCPGSQCVSTGRFCIDGTDFAGYSCVDDLDCCSSAQSCPAGACEGAEATPTATRTPVVGKTNTPTVRVATSTPRPGAPTSTATPTSPSAGTPLATNTLGPTPTFRPEFGVVAVFAPAGSTVLEVLDASNFPGRGTVQIGGQATSASGSGAQAEGEAMLIGYDRCTLCARSNMLRLTTPLSSDVPAGTVVRAFSLTPTVVTEQVFQAVGTGAGCSIAGGSARGGVVALIAVAVLCGVVRRRHIRS
jgi:hypothetical protein